MKARTMATLTVNAMSGLMVVFCGAGNSVCSDQIDDGENSALGFGLLASIAVLWLDRKEIKRGEAVFRG